MKKIVQGVSEANDKMIDLFCFDTPATGFGLCIGTTYLTAMNRNPFLSH